MDFNWNSWHTIEKVCRHLKHSETSVLWTTTDTHFYLEFWPSSHFSARVHCSISLKWNYLDEYDVNARVFSVYSDASAVWSVPVHGCGTFGWYAGRSINTETLLSTGSIHEHVMLLYSIVSYSTNGSRYKHKHIRSTLCTHITCAVKIR